MRRRSGWKVVFTGKYFQQGNEPVEAIASSGKKGLLVTRKGMMLKSWVGRAVVVPRGKAPFRFQVRKKMLGMRFGELSFGRLFPAHMSKKKEKEA